MVQQKGPEVPSGSFQRFKKPEPQLNNLRCQDRVPCQPCRVGRQLYHVGLS